MKRIAWLCVLALSLGGCVSAGKYKNAVEEGKSLQAKVEALGSEVESLKSANSAKIKEVQDKSDDLHKQLQTASEKLKEAEEKLAALQKSQAELEKQHKDLLKMSDLLKTDNERLEKLMQDRKAEYGKASAKIKAALDEADKSLQ